MRLTAGMIALVWPGPTALVLVLIVAFWAFVGGFAEIFLAFGVVGAKDAAGAINQGQVRAVRALLAGPPRPRRRTRPSR
jgi:uncharacterized membrane protein HdeD (DUF308 family)